MDLTFAYYGNPLLRKRGKEVKEVTSEIKQVVSEMQEMMMTHRGIGLAAPQVSLSLALFVTAVPIKQPDGKYIPGPFKVYINPKILAQSEEKDLQPEGCVSLPGLYGEVLRSKWVKIQAMNLEGEIFEEELSELDAHCFLHEFDHINGVLFIDHIEGKAKQELIAKWNEIKKNLQQTPSLPGSKSG